MDKIAQELVEVAKLLTAAPRMPRSVSKWYETFKKEGRWSDKKSLKEAIQRAFDNGDITESQADALEKRFKVGAKSFVAIRFEQRRDWYAPKGVKPVTPAGTDLELYIWEGDNGTPYLMGFMGKQNKPYLNYRFKDERQRDQYAEKEIKYRKEALQRKQEELEKRKQFRHDFQKGDILYSSWGYDQTNVSFYQVVDLTEKSVKLREVNKKVVREERGADYVVAVPNKFVSGTLTKRVSPHGSVRINSSEHASKWDGKPKYETAAGWGH